MKEYHGWKKNKLQLETYELEKIGFVMHTEVALSTHHLWRIRGEDIVVEYTQEYGVWWLSVGNEYEDRHHVDIDIKFLHQLYCLLVVLGIQFNMLTDK